MLQENAKRQTLTRWCCIYWHDKECRSSQWNVDFPPSNNGKTMPCVWYANILPAMQRWWSKNIRHGFWVCSKETPFPSANTMASITASPLPHTSSQSTILVSSSPGILNLKSAITRAVQTARLFTIAWILPIYIHTESTVIKWGNIAHKTHQKKAVI